MSAPDDFTGERFIPGVPGEIAYEHCHRYAFARRFVAGRRVLDAACGEGYGAALLADVARSVVGVDIEASVVADASSRYGAPANLRFETASVAQLPLADASVDAIVSFETIEHLTASDQSLMLAEFARVLAHDGLLILSSPNRPEYSDARDYANPFHLCELDRDELAARLRPQFPAHRWFAQRRFLGSAIWSEAAGERFEALSGSAADVHQARVPVAMYYVVLAGRDEKALPAQWPALSLYADGEDSEWSRIDREAREVLRLDGLLRTRDEELRALARNLDTLNVTLGEREADRARLEAARAHLARALDDANRSLEETRRGYQAECDRLNREIEAQARVVAYRASARWWLRLPFVRARGAWNRIRAA